MQNYIGLGKGLLSSWQHYVYLDTEDLLAKSLIRRHMVRVKVDGIMTKEGEKYRLVSLKVLKKDEPKFLQAMEELKGKMLLFGHLDYESRGGELIEMTRAEIMKEAAETGRVPLPTGGTVKARALPEN